MTYFLGWGSPYFSGGHAATTPALRANAGTASTWRANFLFGVDITDGAPDYGTQVDYTVTFYPAGGGAPTIGEYLDYGNVFYGFEVYESAQPHDPLIGVFEITALVGGEAAGNKLVLAATPFGEGGGYSAQAWYEEAAEPPVSAFWTRFINSKEVIE